jgi:hypothetical protein
MSKIRLDGSSMVMLPTAQDVVTQAPVGILKDIVIEKTGANAVANGHLLQYNADSLETVTTPFIVSTEYTILVPGTTDFTLIGAADSVIGTVFTATGIGAGDGTATTPEAQWQNSNVIDGGTY